jgi:hypothetical protein
MKKREREKGVFTMARVIDSFAKAPGSANTREKQDKRGYTGGWIGYTCGINMHNKRKNTLASRP